MNKINSLSLMPNQEYWDMLNRRIRSMAKILNIPHAQLMSRTSFIKNNRHQLITVSLIYPKNAFDVFDETNAAIGENWIWENQICYFVRESDATWFRLRWS